MADHKIADNKIPDNKIPDNKIRVTLMKSIHGRLQSHKDTVRGLGLRRIRHSVEVNDTPEIRGMINKISYMVKVEE